MTSLTPCRLPDDGVIPRNRGRPRSQSERRATPAKEMTMAHRLTKSQKAKLDRLQKALENSWDELDKKSRRLVAINDDPESKDSWIEAIGSLAYAGVDYHKNHDAVFAYRDEL